MENSSFHSQLLSVMEVLATAAVGEINRRVDDSCAVLRLEVRQSRRDIDLLKKKCELMEAELRRSRIRARRRAAERFSPRVKVMLNKETPRSAWEGELEAEAHNHLQQCVDEADVHILIKEERSEENMWKSCSEDKLGEPLPCFNAPQPPQTDSFAKPHPSAETPADPGSVFSPVDPYASFPEQQQLNRIQVVAELLVKHERTDDPDEHAAPPPGLADPFGVEGRDGEPWSSADAGFSYGEPVPSTLASQSGLLLEDFPPQNRSVNAGAAREKRRFRMFGCKKPRTDEGVDSFAQILTTDPCLIPQQLHHQSGDSSPHTRSPGEDFTPPASASFCRHTRSGYGAARRAKTPWRPGGLGGEKRFSCTYCDKSFMRFSQLKEHLRSHTGEKPFSCPLCGRSFTKQCNLIRHAVVHSGEKPYECAMCGKCFTQRSSLKSHQKTAH
ncbi:uncharacterized protein si:ch211-155e24.3 isoform X1 [Antennarius striatus]|uniref:uncharacterized protein si:ch211-155e24.3 isoform X1 n=1 Tax=Antennarius striatus TaxID=241820 RepID=UPI0035B03AE1